MLLPVYHKEAADPGASTNYLINHHRGKKATELE